MQVEFRSPAGAGQYLTLAPRDKIVATPYALYALNSTASQWDYNPKTQALTSAQNVAKVGIGTNAPTAALEVVAAGGDDAVKLPAGSIGAAELSSGIGAAGHFHPAISVAETSDSQSFLVGVNGYLLISGVAQGGYPGNSSGYLVHRIYVDDVQVWEDRTNYSSAPVQPTRVIHALVPVLAGEHVVKVKALGSSGWTCSDDVYVQFLPNLLFGD